MPFAAALCAEFDRSECTDTDARLYTTDTAGLRLLLTLASDAIWNDDDDDDVRCCELPFSFFIRFDEDDGGSSGRSDDIEPFCRFRVAVDAFFSFERGLRLVDEFAATAAEALLRRRFFDFPVEFAEFGGRSGDSSSERERSMTAEDDDEGGGGFLLFFLRRPPPPPLPPPVDEAAFDEPPPPPALVLELQTTSARPPNVQLLNTTANWSSFQSIWIDSLAPHRIWSLKKLQFLLGTRTDEIGRHRSSPPDAGPVGKSTLIAGS